MEAKKKIYIVISQTGSIVSKFIRIVTRDRYNHVSVTLDKELNTMYSFGRIYTYNPFIGGFVKESVNNGAFKRFIRNTVAVILELEIPQQVSCRSHAGRPPSSPHSPRRASSPSSGRRGVRRTRRLTPCASCRTQTSRHHADRAACRARFRSRSARDPRIDKINL